MLGGKVIQKCQPRSWRKTLPWGTCQSHPKKLFSRKLKKLAWAGMPVLGGPVYLLRFEQKHSPWFREKSRITEKDAPRKQKRHHVRPRHGGRSGQTTASPSKKVSVRPSNFLFTHEMCTKTHELERQRGGWTRTPEHIYPNLDSNCRRLWLCDLGQWPRLP